MTNPAKKPYNKKWLSVSDQVSLLESRSLIVKDRATAEEFLGYANYYRFSGYCLAFQDKPDHFRSGTEFDHIVYAYQFDSDLRSLVGDWLELAEIDLRTQAVHLFSLKYGPFGHCIASNFTNPFSKKMTHADWLTRLQKDTNDSSKERCVEHFRNSYSQYPDLPLWAAAEVMTFGCLSRFIGGMNRKDRKQLAKHYQLNSDEFASMVHHLSYVRNVCAHHGRLWERLNQIKPLLPVNSVMTATYWEIGRRIIELEQGGRKRAKYGIQLIERLAIDLTERFGRGFSEANIQYMRRFYVEWTIPQTLSGELHATKLDPKNRLMSSKPQTLSGQLNQTGSIETVAALSPGFPLPWSHYIKLLAVRENDARSFYEREALRGGCPL